MISNPLEFKKHIQTNNDSSETSSDRKVLRKAMGFSFVCEAKPYTPFRMNQNVVPFCGADGVLGELRKIYVIVKLLK